MNEKLKDVDPFSPENFKTPTSAESGHAVKQLTSVPVRKPNKMSFVRAAEKTALSMNCTIIDTKDDVYLLSADVAQALLGSDFLKVVNLTVSVDRQGNFFLWPTVPEVTELRRNEWTHSARVAKELAKTKWIRVASNMAAGCYDLFEATADIPDPNWGTNKMEDYLRVAFNNRTIMEVSNQVIQTLLGKA